MSQPLEEIDSGNKAHYKRGEMIGVGAYKTVYKGYNTTLGTECCWNEVPIFGLQPKEHNKIFQEILLLRSLNSPHIIHIKDSWNEKDKIVFITDLLSSGTLKGYIKEIGKVSLQSVKKWSKQILEGISHLHGRGIIHRDIKCENIFMNGVKGDLKIGDLGLSVIKDHAESRKLSVIGTTPFVAPELYRQDYSEKVDIYAFGMSILELVTGEYPYHECENDYQIIIKVTSHPMVPPGGLKKIKDPLVQDFIKRCIEEDPVLRPSADELLQDPFVVMNEEDKKVFFNYDQKDKDESSETPSEQPIFDFRKPKEVVLSPTKDSNQVAQEVIRGKNGSKIREGNGEGDPAKIISLEPVKERNDATKNTKIEEDHQSGGKSSGHSSESEGSETKEPDDLESNENSEISKTEQTDSNSSSPTEEEEVSIPDKGRPVRPKAENGGQVELEDSNSKEGSPDEEGEGEENEESSEEYLGKSDKRPPFRTHTKNLCKILIEQTTESESSLNVYLLIKNDCGKEIKGEEPGEGDESELKEIAFPFNVKNDTAEEISEELYRSCSDFIRELSEKDINLICEAIKQGLSSVKSSNRKAAKEAREAKIKEEKEKLKMEENENENANPETENPEPNPSVGETEVKGENGNESASEDDGEEVNGENGKKKPEKPPELVSLVKKMEELLFNE